MDSNQEAHDMHKIYKITSLAPQNLKSALSKMPMPHQIVNNLGCPVFISPDSNHAVLLESCPRHRTHVATGCKCPTCAQAALIRRQKS